MSPRNCFFSNASISFLNKGLLLQIPFNSSSRVGNTEQVKVTLPLILQENIHTILIKFTFDLRGLRRHLVPKVFIEDSNGRIIRSNIPHREHPMFQTSIQFSPKYAMKYFLTSKLEDADRHRGHFSIINVRAKSLVIGSEMILLYKELTRGDLINWSQVTSFFKDERIPLTMKKEASQYQCDDDVNTPLHLACLKGNVTDLIIKLVEIGGMDVILAENDYGDTPLHIASKTGNISVIHLLIQAGGLDAIKAEADYGFNPLHRACQNGQIDAVRVLVESGGKDLIIANMAL